MTNQEAGKLAKQFLETGSSTAFEKLWSSTVNMIQLYKYYDPTGARTSDDFLQLTRIGLYQALNTFIEGKGSTILTWIRMRMEQMCIKEVRKITRKGFETKISLDVNILLDRSNNRSTVEQLIYQELICSESYQQASVEWSEELYWQIITDVSDRIGYNYQILRCFNLKLAFPNISRDTISKMLKISRPTISHYFTRIRKCISLATAQYAI